MGGDRWAGMESTPIPQQPSRLPQADDIKAADRPEDPDDRPPAKENQALDARMVKNAVIISCIIGVLAAAYLVYETSRGENYAALYLIPDSYSNYMDGNNVNFTYGITQYGRRSDKYILSVYMGDQLIATRDLKQKIGVNEVVLKVPEDVKLPAAVKLVLETDHGTTEVHFWIKGRKGDNETGQ